MEREHRLGKRRLVLREGDLTKSRCEAIVNAANSGLLGGGGVDGAIHAAGGPSILEACKKLRATTHRRGLPVGEAVATPAGDLPCRLVIHTVGPIFGEHDDGDALLRSCARNALRLAEAEGVRSVAFPAISAGIFGYPKELSARLLLGEAIDHLQGGARSVKSVHFVLYGEATFGVFCEVCDGLLGERGLA